MEDESYETIREEIKAEEKAAEPEKAGRGASHGPA